MQGSDNMQDGISFCQTAEGYLEEVIDMLHRMNELSVKAANGTNSASDRLDIDGEIGQLKEETKRIFKTAKFNEIKIFNMPYAPAPSINTDYSPNKTILKQINSNFPPGASLDSATASSHLMTNTYRKNGINYNSASYIDFSGVDFNDISKLDNTGFFSSCCTCTDKYCITFDSSTTDHTVSGSDNYTYTVGTAGVNNAAELVQRIVTATGGCPQNHFTNYEADPTNMAKLVVYDNRPTQTARPGYGQLDAGVTKEITYKDQGDELQVFSSGLDENKNVKYGGIELNDVRHTWDEMGIVVSSDGKTFASSQTAKFTDYNGEYVELHVTAEDPLSQVLRRNYWSADENGIYVNKVLASNWEDMGIKEENNYGEYSFRFREQEIFFEVNPGDSLTDVIENINGVVLQTPYTWDIMVSDKVSSQALSIFDVNAIRVTESNKNKLDETYWIEATADTDSEKGHVRVASSGSSDSSHVAMKWNEFENQSGIGSDVYKEYPISDWGVDDEDEKATDSDLITFDDTAVYTYENQEADLKIRFSFNLKDETGMDEAIAGLNGVQLNKTFSAPNAMTSSASTIVPSSADPAYTPNAPTVKLNRTSISYETQKAYGRDFDNPAATMSGTVNRVLHTKNPDNPDVREWDANQTSGTILDSTNTSDVYIYISEKDRYYKVTETQKNYTDTYKKNHITEKTFDAYYSYENAVFNGNDLDSIGNGKDFIYIETLTDHMEKTDSRTVTSYSSYDPDKDTGLTKEQIDAMGSATTIVSSLDSHTSVSTVSDWHKISSDLSKSSTANDSVTLSSSKGEIGTLIVSDRTNSVGNATLNFDFTAKGYATCDFNGAANSYASGNKNDTIHLWDTKLNIPPRELDIQCSSDNPDYITLKWSGMNNAIIGIQTTNTKTIPSARRAISEVGNAIKFVSDTRSLFGAQQNRLEHAIRINNNTAENTQAAESIIRDTDMAKEMVQYSKHNILAQAGQSMISQANQSSQGVLSLLS